MPCYSLSTTSTIKKAVRLSESVCSESARNTSSEKGPLRRVSLREDTVGEATIRHGTSAYDSVSESVLLYIAYMSLHVAYGLSTLVYS